MAILLCSVRRIGLKPRKPESWAGFNHLALRDEGQALRPRPPDLDCLDDGADDLLSRLPFDDKVSAHTAAIFRYIDDKTGGREWSEGTRNVAVVFEFGAGMVIVADAGNVNRSRRVNIVDSQGCKLEEIGKAMGGKQVVATPRRGPFDCTIYQSTHNCGGAVMGSDPNTSAVNTYLQSWDVPNVLPKINPTFEWIRLAQRIPVRVHLDSIADGVELRVGTTASVLVMTGDAEPRDTPPVPVPVPAALR